MTRIDQAPLAVLELAFASSLAVILHGCGDDYARDRARLLAVVSADAPCAEAVAAAGSVRQACLACGWEGNAEAFGAYWCTVCHACGGDDDAGADDDGGRE